jgi:predicted GNAT family N-acyltransferase
VLGLAVEGQEDVPRQRRRQKQQSGCDDLPGLLAKQTPAETAQDGPDQRSKENDRRHGLALHHVGVFDVDGSTGAEEDQIAAYLRIVPAGISFDEASLGRVLSTKAWRGSGVGQALMSNGIKALRQLYPEAAVRIGAQAYLEKFYGSFGFQTVSDVYLEDDIPHIDMLLPAAE